MTLIMALAILCNTVESTTVTSEFKVNGNGTVTQYSYLKVSKLEESAYTEGYKAGSLNYLDKGEIELRDYIEFYDGLEDEPHREIGDYNSTLTYEQNVNFTGNKGISEFYGKGFFPNNRAISAWKKIRYDDLSYNKSYDIIYLGGASRIARSNGDSRVVGSYDLGDSLSASKINVTAWVIMGPKGGRQNADSDYEFEYNANVENGVVEIRDATGWTNRTGRGRIDWERDALMRGNFTIENDLSAVDLFVPAGGPKGDWLSCCIGGGDQLRMEIEKSEGERPKWPNEGTYATLKPTQKLPTQKREQNCTIVYIPSGGYTAKCENLSYEKFDCTGKNCPGFECIYQIPPIQTGNQTENQTENQTGTESVEPIIDMKKTLYDNGDTQKKYEISVGNTGIAARNFVVVDVLPDGVNCKKENITWESKSPIEVNVTSRQTDTPTNPALNISFTTDELGSNTGMKIYLTASMVKQRTPLQAAGHVRAGRKLFEF